MNAPTDLEHGKAKLFKLNRSQAVRLPKSVAFPDDVAEVVIRRVGRSLVLTPTGEYWKDFFAHGPNLDYPERAPQPPYEERESF